MKYRNSNIEVKVGDTVSVNFTGKVAFAKVSNIIYPGTQDAIDWSAPEGGIMVESEETGLILCNDFENDEDVKFVRRTE